MNKKNIIRDNQILNIPDLIWIDYISIVLWGQSKQSSNLSFTLGKDFPVIQNLYILFGIIIELYCIGVIKRVSINHNMKRLITLGEAEREGIMDGIVSQEGIFINWYNILKNENIPCDIEIEINKPNLSRFLNKRLKKWEGGELNKNTSNPVSIEKQKEILGNHIIKMIRGDGLMGKNLKVPCIQFINDPDRKTNQDLIVSDTNPFLTLYSFEKEKLIHINSDDLLAIKISLDADINIDDSKNLYLDEVIYKYGFIVPINKAKNGIFFNEETGTILIKGKNVGRLKNGTRGYKLFQFLYHNQGKSISTQEIVEAIGSIQEEKDRIVSDIKREIPENIRPLIQSNKGSYRLIEDSEINP